MGNVQGKGQEGGINQVDMNTSELLSQAMGQTGLQQRVELRLSARGLPKKDKLRCVIRQSHAVSGWRWCPRQSWRRRRAPLARRRPPPAVPPAPLQQERPNGGGLFGLHQRADAVGGAGHGAHRGGSQHARWVWRAPLAGCIEDAWRLCGLLRCGGRPAGSPRDGETFLVTLHAVCVTPSLLSLPCILPRLFSAPPAEPSWVRPVLASYSQGSAQPMRVVVYDVDKVTRTAKQTKGLNLASQDYLGGWVGGWGRWMCGGGGTGGHAASVCSR